jgi:hypothetical protein
VLFGLWTRRTCTGGREWGAFGRDTGGIENRQGQLREGLRIGSLGVGSHGGHGIVLAATKQAAGAFGLIRPGTLGVDYPGVACSRGCYMHGGMSRICGKLFDRPHIVECRPHGSHEFPFRHTGAPLCCLTSTFSARFLESVRGADGSSIAREVLGIGLVLGFERSV